MYKLSFITLCSVILMLVITSKEADAQDKHMHEEYPISEDAAIGEVNFDVNCSDAVKEDFDQAMAMLHNMMYETARDNFKAISEEDPSCAMAYWGTATTLFQPLWGTRPSEEELRQGWQYIDKATELVETEREKLLVESTAAFFRDPQTADFRTRIEGWADAMEVAYEAYPDDTDIAAFYGLSRLTIGQFAEKRAPLLDEAEGILRNVFEQSPTHPGAIHYSIHATDADGRAENALDIVEAYGEIAPAVPHALHMPTHIYVRMGNWPKVIEWNKRSSEAALNHPVDDAESHHYVHAVDYLVYAYLQRGEDQKAEEVFKKALKKEKHQASFISAFHLAALPARLAVERQDWERAAKLEPRTPDYLPWDASLWAEGLTWFARGLGAVHIGDLDAAKDAQQKLIDLRDRAKTDGADDMASYIEIDSNVLAGRIAHAEGDHEKAVELTRTAADLESTVEKHPVTPGALLPPNEALGNLYLELERPKEAFDAYEASDAIWPGRYNTLLGAARAAQMAANSKAAQTYYERLLANVGDSKRTSVEEARRIIAQQ